MTRNKWVVIACFCVALVAGAAAGIVLRPVLVKPPRRPTLEEQLGLSDAQREQMRQIWSALRDGRAQRWREQTEALVKERDDAVAALLTVEQKAQYDNVLRGHAAKMAALEAERRKPFEEAMAKTRGILTEEQWKKFEELRQAHGGGPRGPRGRPGERGEGPPPGPGGQPPEGPRP